MTSYAVELAYEIGDLLAETGLGNHQRRALEIALILIGNTGGFRKLQEPLERDLEVERVPVQKLNEHATAPIIAGVHDGGEVHGP